MDFQDKFNSLEDNVERTVDGFEGRLPKANEELFEIFQDFYFELERDSKGNIKPTKNCLRLMSRIRQANYWGLA
jgi:hypothetical protein